MWNNLDLEVLNAWSIKPEAYYLKIVFLIVKVIEESKLVTRLGFSPSHFRERKSKHSFQDTLNSNCICGLDVELSSHYIFRCPIYHDKRYTLSWADLIPNLTEIWQRSLWSCSLDPHVSTQILYSNIGYISTTERYDESLISKFSWFFFFCINWQDYISL